jgi:hypothetical protein
MSQTQNGMQINNLCIQNNPNINLKTKQGDRHQRSIPSIRISSKSRPIPQHGPTNSVRDRPTNNHYRLVHLISPLDSNPHSLWRPYVQTRK